MQVRDRHFLVVGFARSGLAATNFLLRRGASATITDLRDASALSEQIARLAGPAELVLGEHRVSDFLAAECIVLSPGVPASLPQLTAAKDAGIPILAEVELASIFLRSSIIGVTGSNGKTTTTSWIAHTLAQAGRHCEAAGNIGTALIGVAEREEQPEIAAVELSSFQLETIRDFHCRIAVLLNITPDHLDRYSSLEDYARAKRRIFLNQRANDKAVLNRDDPAAWQTRTEIAGRVFPFSRKMELNEGVFVRQGEIVIRRGGIESAAGRVSEISLPGAHNLENALAAAAACSLSGLHGAEIARGLSTFQGVEHRLEWCGEIDGIAFINDSKATNVDSAAKAIESFDGNLLLIMGGLDKGGDFSPLAPLVRRRVKRLCVIGAASEKIRRELGEAVPTAAARNLAEALDIVLHGARPGDRVLLAPGCASFDQFKDYEHRGRTFKSLVAEKIAQKRSDDQPVALSATDGRPNRQGDRE